LNTSPSRIAVVAIALVALAIGIALGSRLRSPQPEPAQAPSKREVAADAAGEVARLELELDRERGRSGALELELALLRREIGPGADAATAAKPGTPASDPAADASEDAETSVEDTPGRKEWFDASKLVDLGVDERHAEWLRDSFENLQMEELYLRDRATRERWLQKPRYGRELHALRDEARGAIGEEDYDRMLFGSGRHNRVVLSDVLQNSPAAEAGIQAGDVLVRYDDRPVYDVRDLLAETARGELGESAAVDVERDGELLRFFVARGPLGARVQPRTHPPAAQP
jgi:hypothetical protein